MKAQFYSMAAVAMVACGLAILAAGSTSAGEAGNAAAPGKEQFKARLLARFDANGDGQLDEAERQAAKAEFQKRRQDGGKGNGQFGKEFRQKVLSQFDANGDGRLDEAERQAAKAEFQKRRAGRKQPGE